MLTNFSTILKFKIVILTMLDTQSMRLILIEGQYNPQIEN